MATHPPTTPKGLYSPGNWPVWLGFALLRVVIYFPYSWLIHTSHILAYPAKFIASRRRRIADINLQACFSHLDSRQRNKLVHAHFASIIMGIFEIGMAWWLPKSRLKNKVDIEGKEHLEQALQHGKGVLLISPHFTCLEIIGRLFTTEIKLPWSGMYRPHENPVVEYFFRRDRSQFFSKLISRNDIRTFVKELRKNQVVWYAPDQNFSKKGFIMAPFFGIPAPTHPGTPRIVKMSGARVVPMEYHRKEGNQGYSIKFHPPLENYPSEDELENATRLNACFEKMIINAPEQYFWLHRKFKNKNPEQTDIYRQQGIT